MKCQPLNFKGTKGVVGLIRWFEKMETVFQISNYPDKYQVKYATCTLLNNALTCWNSHKGTIGTDAAFSMSWRELMKLMAENATRANTTGNNERKVYTRLLPLFNKCKFHHEGPCTVRCGKCNKVGNLTRDYKATISTTSNQRGQLVNQSVLTCLECGKQGYFRSDCPKLKDQNRGNKTRNRSGTGEARGKAYALGGRDANLDSKVITDVSYVVDLADRRTFRTNTILRGCMLGLLGQPYNIDLMPVELGSFDVIIDMDWLANHHAVIVCDEKIMRIPYEDEILIVQVMKKKTKDKSEEKRLEDVPTIQDFMKVFSLDLPGLPPT
uniref:CCHC-type domain-containing protein n=1 Tax=Tanacetum cinerariifolium TaxID=118510 RepID=A0A699KGN6_TANCI|nr:hypothetical protein [Tanacetum cinerariifolium]